MQVCGNGVVTPSEECDDNNTIAADGCTNCTIDYGWECSINATAYTDLFAFAGADLASTCVQVCGNGIRTWLGFPEPTEYDGALWLATGSFANGDEECDDGNDDLDDGCEHCRVQFGWQCTEDPISRLSTCFQICGNGIRTRDEECDDGNSVAGEDDGCSPSCEVELGWVCSEPGPIDWTSDNPDRGTSVCTEVCGTGNAIRTKFEECDDGNNADGDGCSGVCVVEAGWGE